MLETYVMLNGMK